MVIINLNEGEEVQEERNIWNLSLHCNVLTVSRRGIENWLNSCLTLLSAILIKTKALLQLSQYILLKSWNQFKSVPT